MKKQVLAVAVVAFLTLSGCDAQPNERAAANVETVADDIEARANALEAQALNATMPVDDPMRANSADPVTNTTGNQSAAER